MPMMFCRRTTPRSTLFKASTGSQDSPTNTRLLISSLVAKVPNKLNLFKKGELYFD